MSVTMAQVELLKRAIENQRMVRDLLRTTTPPLSGADVEDLTSDFEGEEV